MTLPQLRSCCRVLAYSFTNMSVVQCRLNVNVSALKIHMSENAHNAIMTYPGFITESRGDISIKVVNCYNVNNGSFAHFLLNFFGTHIANLLQIRKLNRISHHF